MDVDKQVDNSSLTEEEVIQIKKKEKCVSCRNMSKLFAFPLISPIFMAIRDIMSLPIISYVNFNRLSEEDLLYILDKRNDPNIRQLMVNQEITIKLFCIFLKYSKYLQKFTQTI